MLAVDWHRALRGRPPDAPGPAEATALLGELAELIAGTGWANLVRPPVQPGPRSFPDPWEPSPAGIELVVRRLLWYADLDLAIAVEDRRDQAGPRPRRAVTEAEVATAGVTTATLALYAVGDDEVAGTLAHEIGVAWAIAVRRRAAGPYRADETNAGEPTAIDLRRGSIAAVALGYGALATSAAYQQYTGGDYQAHLGYAPIEYDVIQAGHLPLASMAFLVAVQAEVRGETGSLAGLRGPAGDEVAAWRRALAGQGAMLRAALGVPEPSDWPDTTRPRPVPFAAAVPPDAARPTAGKRVFRVRGNRGVLGAIGGAIAGSAATFGIGLVGFEVGAALVAGAVGGLLFGQRVAVARCSECIERVAVDATCCPRCGGRFVGDIADRDQRLAAEEKLERDGSDDRSASNG